ncbi:MAG: CcmD family protein [Chloroherpetonaceae bacterium]|nr:CcmD family protein [Chloroherpetonaceae bacterium]MDW8438129.1 CcmD family protein [Chloroherpetonaceae bacterium]
MIEFLVQHSIYVVLVIALVIWTGVFFYLFRLDRKLAELERIVAEKEKDERNES